MSAVDINLLNVGVMPKVGCDSRKVLDYMLEGNTLTTLDAARMWDLLSLNQRIYDLRHIYAWTIYYKDETSGKKKWKRYSIVKLEGYSEI